MSCDGVRSRRQRGQHGDDGKRRVAGGRTLGNGDHGSGATVRTRHREGGDGGCKRRVARAAGMTGNQDTNRRPQTLDVSRVVSHRVNGGGGESGRENSLLAVYRDGDTAVRVFDDRGFRPCASLPASATTQSAAAFFG